jgi:hypothetical protein
MRRLGRIFASVRHCLPAVVGTLILPAIIGYPVYRIVMSMVEQSGPWPVAACGIVSIGVVALPLFLDWRRRRGKTQEEIDAKMYEDWIRANEREYPMSLYGLGPNPGADPPDQPETPPPARGK